jgi:hypothetical protein
MLGEGVRRSPMTRRGTVLAMALAVGTVPAFADNARPRGGGGGGGSSVGSSHHSSGSGGSSHHSGGGSSSSGSGTRPTTGAESRHPRAGTGTGSHYYGHGYGHGYYPYYGYPYYGYRPYYYGYGPYWYGYSPYYYGGFGYGYGYGGYDGYGEPGYSSGYSQESGAIRTFVEPSKTKIYVDGRYAGTADDFDGMMQRLYVSPGAHEIMLGLEGYKTHRVKVYVAPGATLKLHFDMVKGSGEDAQIDTLGNPDDEQWGKRDRRYDNEKEEDGSADDEVRREEPRSPEPDDAAEPRHTRDRDPQAGLSWGNELGRVRLDIQPGDASVYVDGRFRGPANGLRSLRLDPGKHHLEVVRPGFRTEERDVDVRDGEDTTLELELSRS